MSYKDFAVIKPEVTNHNLVLIVRDVEHGNKSWHFTFSSPVDDDFALLYDLVGLKLKVSIVYDCVEYSGWFTYMSEPKPENKKSDNYTVDDTGILPLDICSYKRCNMQFQLAS